MAANLARWLADETAATKAEHWVCLRAGGLAHRMVDYSDDLKAAMWVLPMVVRTAESRAESSAGWMGEHSVDWTGDNWVAHLASLKVAQKGGTKAVHLVVHSAESSDERRADW